MPVRYVEALVGIFLNLLANPPKEFYTKALLVSITILELDQLNDTAKNNAKELKQLREIMEKTHEKLNMPLARAEAIVDSTPIEEWGKKLEDLQDIKGKRVKIDGNYPSTLDIYQLLKESYLPVLLITSKVIRGYSMDVKFNFGESAGSPKWLEER